MQQTIAFISFLLLMSAGSSCKKNNGTGDCFPADATVRQITDQPATIKANGSQFYIVEQGAVDTRLNPCYLPMEFKIHDLPVIISGKVKATVHLISEPCCTENFVVTKITN